MYTPDLEILREERDEAILNAGSGDSEQVQQLVRQLQQAAATDKAALQQALATIETLKVCVYVYAYLCGYVYACMRVCVCVLVYACVVESLQVCMCMQYSTYIHTRAHTLHTHIRKRSQTLHVHTHRRAIITHSCRQKCSEYPSLYLAVHVHTYMHTYIHTHMSLKHSYQARIQPLQQIDMKTLNLSYIRTHILRIHAISSMCMCLHTFVHG
jgi:hypothetical protein